MNKSIDAHECFNRSNPSEVKSFPAIEINKREILNPKKSMKDLMLILMHLKTRKDYEKI